MRCESCRSNAREWSTPHGEICTECAEGRFGLELPYRPERKAPKQAKLTEGAAYHLRGCRGFTQITHEAFEALASLPHADFRVYVAIVADCNWKTGLCDSSREQLAKRACVGSASIPRAIKRLVEAGLISVEYKGGFNGHNLYTVEPPDRFRPARAPTADPGQSAA